MMQRSRWKWRRRRWHSFDYGIQKGWQVGQIHRTTV